MADINISNLTNGTSVDNGTGVFDLLIKSVELHISSQLTQGRITTEDYAQVYLGALQSTLSESIKFLLTEQQAGLEADLLTEKIQSENKNNETDGVIDKQKADIVAGTAIKTQQELTEVQTTALTLEKVQSENKNNEANGVIDLGKLKLKAEADLLGQKKYTEEAQIEDSVNSSAVAGVIGKQKSLYAAQTAGFARDAEQKLSKIMADVYAVQRGTDEALSPPLGAQNDDISKILKKAAEGIGVDSTTT